VVKDIHGVLLMSSLVRSFVLVSDTTVRSPQGFKCYCIGGDVKLCFCLIVTRNIGLCKLYVCARSATKNEIFCPYTLLLKSSKALQRCTDCLYKSVTFKLSIIDKDVL